MFDIIYLKFKGPLHIDDGRNQYLESDVIVHSDKFYALLMNEYYRNNPLGKPDFKFALGSAFPYFKVDENKTLHFFPRPVWNFSEKILTGSKYDTKKFKKIKWVEKEIYIKILAGDLNAVDLDKTNFATGQHNEFLYNTNDCKEFTTPFFHELTARAAISRNNDDANPFYVDKLIFSENAGLFCLLYPLEGFNEQRKEIKQYFEKLGENGLGSYKTIGYGLFETEYHDKAFNIDTPAGNGYYSNLGLYSPENNAVFNNDGIMYNLVSNKGYAFGGNYGKYRRKSVLMATENSLFKFPGEKPGEILVSGNPLLDLTPEKEADEIPNILYRCGKTSWLPVNKID